jgi:TonB family protein
MALTVALATGPSLLVPTAARAESQEIASANGLTAPEIQVVIRRNLGQVRQCYEQLLARMPSASGKVHVTFFIGLAGEVTTVEYTQSSIPDAPFQTCIGTRLKSWRFPAPRGGKPVQVRYPFLFAPL